MCAEGVNMQEPVCGPVVEDYMLKPAFWVDNTRNAAEPVLKPEEVRELNMRSFQRMKEKGRQEALYDLKEYPSILSRDELINIMAEYSGREALTTRTCYNSQGQQITEIEKKEILARANFTSIPDRIQVSFGILVEKQNLRAFPTDTVFAPSPEEIDMDLFQLTGLSANSPVAVLHQSSGGEWTFVQSTIYRGWVRSKGIALVDSRDQIFDFLHTERFLVVTGSRAETEPNPFVPGISSIKYQMGDRLPLAAPNEIPDSIPPGNQQAQSAEGAYVIKVPVRDARGFLKIMPALIARSSDLHQGYLPYTRANLIYQAFKMLGERYGWGGLFDRRDCSRFVMDIYRSVGVIIPRDANLQEAGAAGESIDFSGSIKEREKILNELDAGDPLYLQGHTMLYLGRVGDRYYVIHDGAGYALREESGIKPVTVHGVFVMELHQLLKSGKSSYIEALTTGRKFR